MTKLRRELLDELREAKATHERLRRKIADDTAILWDQQREDLRAETRRLRRASAVQWPISEQCAALAIVTNWPKHWRHWAETAATIKHRATTDEEAAAAWRTMADTVEGASYWWGAMIGAPHAAPAPVVIRHGAGGPTRSAPNGRKWTQGDEAYRVSKLRSWARWMDGTPPARGLVTTSDSSRRRAISAMVAALLNTAADAGSLTAWRRPLER